MIAQRTVWSRFLESRLAFASLAYLVLLLLVAIAGPLLATDLPLAVRDSNGLHFPAIRAYSGTHVGRADLGSADFVLRAPVPYGPDDVDLSHRLEGPSDAHWLGTDDLGRDVLARMIDGTKISLGVGIFASAMALLIGVFLGSLAGYYGGAIDWFVSRVIEVVLCFPFLFLVLAIVALFRPSILVIIVALGITSWTNEARFVRGEFLRIREMEYAYAARAVGARDSRIIFRHLLPNALAPVLVSATFGVASAILVESALSFLGLGVQLPSASWGSILSVADEYLTHAWWLAVFPGVAIFLTVTAYNIIGERLRDAIDPTMDIGEIRASRVE